jgi:hypothetical protein
MSITIAETRVTYYEMINILDFKSCASASSATPAQMLAAV